MSASAALAGPITSFDVRTRSGFTEWDPIYVPAVDDQIVGSRSGGTPVGVPGQGNPGGNPLAFRRLTWGDGGDAGGSFIQVNNGSRSSTENNNPDPVIVGANAVSIGAVRHQNNVIDGTSEPFRVPLTNATLVTQLQFNLGGDWVVIDTLSFDIDFLETANNSDPCLSIVNDEGCGDIFSIDLPSGFNENKEIVRDLAFINDPYYNYTATLTIGGLQDLSDAACAATTRVEGNTGCVGLLTEEGENNRFRTFLRIDATAVPAPGTLLLLAGGLLMLQIGRAHV